MNELIEGPHRSKLTFVASRESTDCLAVDRLMRVREPVSRSKSGVQGKVADVASGRSRHAESQNELKAFRVLLATAHPDAWQEQPFSLEYHHDGTRHRYTPDILVVWGANQEVVEVKEDSEADKPEKGSVILLIEEPGHGNEPLRAPVVEPQEHTVPAQTCLRQHQSRRKQCHVPSAP